MLGWDLHLIYLHVLHLEFFITVLALGLLKTETNTSVKSRMAKNTDKAPTHLQVEANTSVNSRMATGTDKAPTHIPMEENTSVSTKMAKGTDKEPSPL